MDDIIIVGSGFGGAIAALELSKAGAKVTILERGPWRDTLPVQHAGIQQRSALPQGSKVLTHSLYKLQHSRLGKNGITLNRNGLFEFYWGKDINVICTSGVGGGSHAYGGLHSKPLQNNYWDNIGPGLSSESMDEHYAAMLKLFHSQHFQPTLFQPKLFGDIAEIDIDKAPLWGYLFRHDQALAGRMAVSDFSREGPFGSVTGGKTTLDIACLLPARDFGLKIEANTEVISIVKEKDGTFLVVARSGKKREIRCFKGKKLILAAGTINTIKLLLTSRNTGLLAGMPALGKGFSSNADVMAYWPVNTEGANYPANGVYQRILCHKDDIAEGPYLLETGIAGLHTLPLPRRLKKRLQQDLFIAAMGIDSADGELKLTNGQLQIDYNPAASAIYRRIERRIEQLANLSGQRLYSHKKPITVHPLGGARAGDHLENSVVNSYGEVHDVKGLYITDGSAMPTALGSPPSLSIAAWARHVAHGLVQNN